MIYRHVDWHGSDVTMIDVIRLSFNPRSKSVLDRDVAARFSGPANVSSVRSLGEAM
jgi:hypothetical protein